ncbi:hypothetical protein BST61_g8210 [Cercospora zeina]
MRSPTLLSRLVLFVATASAHMQLFHPAPFNASNNPHRTSATADPYLEYPYDCCGPKDRWMYPCRGYEKLLGTPDGAPTATWQAGSHANFTLWGPTELGGNHYGGSCQVGFSTDHGSTFHVATSYEGNCPHRNNGVGPDGQNFAFQVPSDLAPGVQLFAWIWYNREQELNMNCAAVEILAPQQQQQQQQTVSDDVSRVVDASSAKLANKPPAPCTTSYKTADACDCICPSPLAISSCTCSCNDAAALTPAGYVRDTSASSSMAFNTRPLMFVADNGNDCETPRSTAELQYPEPGPEVVSGDGEYPLELPKGACGQVEMLAKQTYSGGSDGN